MPSIRLDFSAPEDTLWKAGEASRSLLQDGCELLRRAGVYGVAHVLAERTTESVAAAVCASAEKVGADAVVVSSSGKGWLQSALQGGSLTRQVLAEAAVPVLVVPPPSRMPDVV